MKVPPDVVATAVFRVAVLLTVAAAAVLYSKRIHKPIVGLVILGVISNTAYALGNFSIAGLVGVPYVGMIGWVLIDYMRRDPSLLLSQLRTVEKDNHALRNDLMAAQLETHILKRPKKT